MSSAYEMFATSSDLEAGGIKLDYGEFQITVARAGGGNRAFQKALRERTSPHRRLIDTESLPEDISRDLLVGVYADTIILGWKGVKGRDGKSMAFNRDNIVKLLKDLPDLFQDIQREASKFTNFKEEDTTSKN